MLCPNCKTEIVSDKLRVRCTCGKELVKRIRAFGKYRYVWDLDTTRTELSKGQKVDVVRGFRVTGSFERGEFIPPFTIKTLIGVKHFKNMDELLEEGWHV